MIKHLLLALLLIHAATLVYGKGQGTGRAEERADHPPKTWLTLDGGEPVVVARGGFSGVCPESSAPAYQIAQMTSLPSTIMLCDLQLTKDGVGYCQYSIDLNNSTLIASVYPKNERTYNVNGKYVKGWFGTDFMANDLLQNVMVSQSNFARTPSMDGAYPMVTPFDIVGAEPRPRLWINVQYPTFFEQRKLSPAKFIQDSAVDLSPEFISSPEIGFLKTIGATIDKTKTKVIFRLMAPDEVEPSTKQKYSSILQDLPMIKAFASGIIVPKEYIWPVDNTRFLQPATSVVSDAHKAGLQVFASGFSNDNYLSYNYSYDPTKEYLQFIDNSQFSVDGVITDFPATASESIACLAHNKNASRTKKNLIITHDGASGDYPGSSDLAYLKAIDDGADIIDCSVQISKDGVAFCLPSIDLTATTTASTAFMDQSTNVPEIQQKDGIFSFDLTWSEIQSLKPQLTSPYDGPLVRNPANKQKGKFVSLSEFLDLAKTKAIPGVLINIENPAYLASKKGIDIVNIVTTALSNATFDTQTTQKVLIQSDDSSVLLKFKDIKNYQRVLTIENDISGATVQIAQEVKQYADAIFVYRNAIVLDYPQPVFMSLNFTNVVKIMHATNVSVYVGVLRNEFQNFLFDYLADPYVEMATFIEAGVDGIVTDFPATAVAYMTSPCANTHANLPYMILPINPGDMFNNLVAAKPPESAPLPPPLQSKDVVDPALPPVAKITESNSTSNSTPNPPSSPASLANVNVPSNKAGLIVATIITVIALISAH